LTITSKYCKIITIKGGEKMKQRKCKLGKLGGCLDYGDCADCMFSKMIDKYERKIKRLKTKIEKLEKVQESGGN
jgi:hypothetical protein